MLFSLWEGEFVHLVHGAGPPICVIKPKGPPVLADQPPKATKVREFRARSWEQAIERVKEFYPWTPTLRVIIERLTR